MNEISRIAVIGAGYVGLTLTFGLSTYGYNVACVDVDEDRIALLNSGISPIHEPGFQDELSRTNADRAIEYCGEIVFTTNAQRAIMASDIVFIAVGTPPTPTGKLNCQFVADAINQNSDALAGKLVVIKSTMQPGATRFLQDHNPHIRIVFSPEFLVEGEAMQSFYHPERFVTGTADGSPCEELNQLFGVDDPITTTYESAEIGKLASNAMLATRISFMNEMAKVANMVGGDIEDIKHIMGTDPRIGDKYLNAGLGWGGSCLPKDVRALTSVFDASSFIDSTPVLTGVIRTNQWQHTQIANQLVRAMNGRLTGQTVAVWGLSFKPGTDDVRESSSLKLINELLDRGVTVHAYDPVVKHVELEKSTAENFKIFDTALDATVDVDAVVLATEWGEFLDIKPMMLKLTMKKPVVIDARNALDAESFIKSGFTYAGIGRYNIPKI